jgi:hypothetical protein
MIIEIKKICISKQIVIHLYFLIRAGESLMHACCLRLEHFPLIGHLQTTAIVLVHSASQKHINHL